LEWGSEQVVVVSDLTHAKKAEASLVNVEKNYPSVDPLDMATIHSALAQGRALREIDTSVRIGLDRVSARAVRPAVTLQWFLTTDGRDICVNLNALESLEPDEASNGVSLNLAGESYSVVGDMQSVAATVFQAVGA
jgi:hypothetical protein